MSDSELTDLRKQLIAGIRGSHAHTTFDKAVNDFPKEARGIKPDGAPHSAWELIEHMRIAQRDILEFSREGTYKQKAFPDGYWPKSAQPLNEEEWDKTVRSFEEDADAFAQLIEKGNPLAKVPHGNGQTLLREAVVLANHNSYHLGQLLYLKKMLVKN